MNIFEVKRQIKAAALAYLAKDDVGFLKIPTHMQRPLIIMGPPGIGKTAIAEQVADELGIHFVAYSITHHTRQSALGLPYIDTAEYGGEEVRVSRYTMSEIIAAVWDSMKDSSCKEGILFLDEVNCASETLAPAMLQFLQYKTFGQHKLPEGWIIVCAGNPPEYNRAARDFDPAMLDRLKVMQVEPDVDVWLNYADSAHIHPAVVSYVAAHPENFYKVRSAATRPRIVTARGWEDLSKILYVYEDLDVACDAELCIQYIQDSSIAQDIANHIELYHDYHKSFNFKSIAAATLSPDDYLDYIHNIQSADIDVHFMVASELFSLCLDEVMQDTIAKAAKELLQSIAEYDPSRQAQVIQDEIYTLMDARNKQFDIRVRKYALALLQNKAPFEHSAQAAINRVLAFASEVLGSGSATTMLVAHLAQSEAFMRFAAMHTLHDFDELLKMVDIQARRLDIMQRVESVI